MNKNLKNKIYDSFTNETPSLLNDIKKRCQNTRQIEPEEVFSDKKKTSFGGLKKVGLAFASVVVFALGCLIGNASSPSNVYAHEASIYLDVNPSIEIQVNKNNKVYQVISNNDDGNKILENVDLKGVELNTALYAIVGAMYTNGYLNENSNSILVSVDNLNDKEVITVKEVTDQINVIFKDNENMNCSIIGQNVEKNEDNVSKSEEYNVSVGKINLIEKIISNDEIYTQDDIKELAEMSIHELNLIFNSYKEKKNDQDNEGNIIVGKPNGYIEKDSALNSVLSYLEITTEEIDYYNTETIYYQFGDDEKKELVYLVVIKQKDELFKKCFVVNCSTGEVKEALSLGEWEDKINDKYKEFENHDGEEKNHDNNEEHKR